MCKNPLLNFDDQNLKSFFASSNQPMLILDSEGKLILEINDSAVKLTGYIFAEAIPQPVENILQTKKNRWASIDADMLSQKNNLKKEFTLISKPGFVEADLATILYQQKEALLFTLTDITDKKLYRAMLEDAIEEEINLKTQNQELKNIAYANLRLARKPLANILGLVDVIDQTETFDQTLVKAISFLKACGQELNEVIKSIDPQLY
ncbi:MAG: PAS domain S-box protein [Janthinobacterium lividum]